jgi:XTP/dITP diphosphohydrolase
MSRKLLIATTNAGKAREIAVLMGDLQMEIVHLGDLPPMPEPPEDQGTFEGNAIRKARHYGGLSKLPTLAEDAGLEIPVLDGWPGVYSSRVAPSDPERVALVLDRMKDHSGEAREARFVSVAAFFNPMRDFVQTFVGVCQGIIIEEPRGRNGFGYDPIFWHPGFGRTMAQLSPDEKNVVSHRGQSFRALAKWLRVYQWDGPVNVRRR